MTDSARVADFDAFRAEQKAAPVKLKIAGKSYDLPTSLPAAIALDIVRMHEELGDDKAAKPEDLMRIGAGVFGGRARFQEILEDAAVGLDELPDLIRIVVEAYKVTPPNPTAPEARG